jgi:hypothetical protein
MTSTAPVSRNPSKAGVCGAPIHKKPTISVVWATSESLDYSSSMKTSQPPSDKFLILIPAVSPPSVVYI